VELLGRRAFRTWKKTLKGTASYRPGVDLHGRPTLPVEQRHSYPQRGFKLTGKPVRSLRESQKSAYSLICANLKTTGQDTSFFDQAFAAHAWLPEGATPKTAQRRRYHGQRTTVTGT